MNIRSGHIIKHTDGVLEFVFNNKHEFHLEDAQEVNQAISKLTTANKPYGMLIDLTAGVSFNFQAVSQAGNNPLERKVAFLLSATTPNMLAETLLDIHQLAYPNKAIQAFVDRNCALEWLHNIH